MYNSDIWLVILGGLLSYHNLSFLICKMDLISPSGVLKKKISGEIIEQV